MDISTQRPEESGACPLFVSLLQHTAPRFLSLSSRCEHLMGKVASSQHSSYWSLPPLPAVVCQIMRWCTKLDKFEVCSSISATSKSSIFSKSSLWKTTSTNQQISIAIGIWGHSTDMFAMSARFFPTLFYTGTCVHITFIAPVTFHVVMKSTARFLKLNLLLVKLRRKKKLNLD